MSDSRVEQERQAQLAAEAERLQKRAEKSHRESKATATSREAFGKLLKDQASTSQQQHDTHKAKGEALRSAAWQEKNKASLQEAEKNSRRSLGDVVQESRAREQTRNLNGQIVENQKNTADADVGRVEQRETGQGKARVEHDDRETEIVVKAEKRRDMEEEDRRVEKREKGRPNAAINGGGGGAAGEGKDDGGEERALAAVKAAQKNAEKMSHAESTSSARGTSADKIPRELLDKFVSTLWLGINEKGLKEFQLEMKDGPWKGALVRITAQDKKVTLRFSRVDDDAKALLEASKGDLMRRLEKKGLRLETLEIRK